MNIAITIFKYFPFGGLQRYMLALANEAVARGHKVTVFCGVWQGDFPEGVDVRVIKRPVWFNVAGVRSFTAAFQDVYNKSEFDLLIGFNKMPGLDFYFLGDSCFAQKALLERSFLYKFAPRSVLYLNYEKSVFGGDSCTNILTQIMSEQKVFARFYSTAIDRFFLWPPDISLKHIQSSGLPEVKLEFRRKLHLPDAAKIILCIGSGFHTKGVDISIAAFFELTKIDTDNKYALVVVGADEPGRYLEIAKNLGVDASVFFLGALSPIGDVLAAADVLLHPARKEMGGNVILESMISGLPVIASKVCGYAPYISRYLMGEVIDSGEKPQNIARIILSVLSVDKNYWSCCAQNLLQKESFFCSTKTVVSILEDFFTSSKRHQVVVANSKQKVILREELLAEFSGRDIFSLMENMPGVVAREMSDRQTLRFEINGQGYYRKWHRGVGWKEVFKNLLQLRMPVLGAKNEWDALNKLCALNVPSLVPLAYGVRGKSPAYQQSFIVTRELTDVIQLDHFFEQHSVSIKTKRLILTKIAVISREMHAAGINHRDFYLCHFMLDMASLAENVEPDIYLIDLHRAQLRLQVPERWLIKDLGGLFFSSLNLHFTSRDYLHFLCVYFKQDLRVILSDKKKLLEKMRARACSTYRRDFGHDPLLPG
ncbi:hypothetical protein O59_000912 [Cellvibrio sp. BR]|uniref:lipopolysaccharide core heptose(I) kinase RfaP n=1 Tax=Cellvibrio sp. BR TaxID=1134474 RepID=UPI0002601823|nr:lipopolysaccharide core heptose(I) kinase RfaP [Cellvibrio sp. BR]EIK46891.1 hypothetical protein O59_000912 [Cellvibrio sp. BR]